MYPLLKMVIYQLDMVVFCFFLGGGCYILSLVVGDSDHFFAVRILARSFVAETS